VAASIGVVYGTGVGCRQRPLIPHLLVIGAAPEVGAEGVAAAQLHRLAQGDVEGEPAEHALLECCGMRRSNA
jgi:hypothetical protein